MNRNDKLIPMAIQAIESKLKNDDGTVAKEFEGYVASFSSSVIQSGLLATLSFYTDGENRTGQNALKDVDGRRNCFLQAIMYMIDRECSKRLLEYVLEKIYNEPGIYGNVDYDFSNRQPDSKVFSSLEDRIIQCAIALKLALRTYKLKK